MSNVRFMVLTAFSFVLAFIGISWASKGFPVLTTQSITAQPDARTATPAPDIASTPRQEAAIPMPPRSAEEKERDKLRLALMQASIGYKLAPCDATMKKNLVVALTNYTGAWANMAGCRFDQCGGNGQQLDDAAAAFKTAADVQVHRELQAAFEQGGITRDDFPQSVRAWVLMFSGLPFGDPNAAACAVGRRAERAGPARAE